jgi:hypothetical protein
MLTLSKHNENRMEELASVAWINVGASYAPSCDV